VLENHGYEVLIASDGVLGIEMARNHRIDVVLLDYDMPGMKGDEVAGVLKRTYPSLPVIILTGFRSSIPETLLRMCDGWLPKDESKAG